VTGPFRIIAPPTPEDAAAVRQVLAAYRFPWEATIARHRRETRDETFAIGFVDEPNSTGTYTREGNRLNIDAVAVRGAAQLQVTLAHELGHLIDDTVLTTDTRGEIHALMHDGSSVALADCPAFGGLDLHPGSSSVWFGGKTYHSAKPQEAFAYLAVHLWCPPFAEPMDRYGPHRFTHRDKIEELVMSDAAQADPPFGDIDGTAHEDDIRWLARHGIAKGEDGRFEPNEPVTRGQMAAFLHRLAGAFGLDG
jgi:hypothetical protein